MANRLEKLIADIGKSGLVESALVSSAAGAIADADADDAAESLANRLIQSGKLTPYQARKLLAGATRGFLLATYKILDQLGQGASSKVFLAEHRKNGGTFALKVLPPQAAAEQERLLARFQREMRLSSLVNHPNVVKTVDVGVAGGVCYIVMDYIPGVNLYDYVKETPGRPLAHQAAAKISLEAAEGLKAIHRAGLIHRDIKPSNILLGTDSRPRILDLGLSLVVGESEDARADPAGLIGTADYAAPEQADNPAGVDPRSDLYSLGCTLYFAVSGRAPFEGGDVLNKIYKHKLLKPKPIESLAPGLPAAFAALIRKLMAKEPANRPQSVEEFQNDLKALQHMA